ncbi:MAG: FG-GAP-like repeat-containing protein, partial [Acidimicrobiia bacterium]
VRVNPTGDPDAPGFGFLGGESHGLAGYPESVAIGDLTGDGANDIVVTTHFGNSEHGRLLIYPQHLTRLGPVTEVVIGARGPSGLGVALGDVDLDGDLDAVVATNAGVEIHHQSGGGLLPAVLIPLVGASHVEIGDVDGDRRPDLVIGTGSTGVRLLRNRADGVFDLSTITNAWTPEIEVADVNLDDRADVVLWECPEDCTEGAVYYGRSDVTFSRSALAVPDHSPPVAVGDFTRDGRPDIVVAHGPVVDVLAQDGAGRFSGVAGWTHGEGYWPSAIEMADMDADGHLEVLVLHQPTGKLVVSAWSNGQSSMIGEYPLHGSQAYPLKGLAIGDVDSDSRPDVAAVDQYRMLYALTQQAPIYVTPDPGGDHVWVRDTVPADGAGGADPAVAPTIRFGRPLDPASVTSEAFSLLDGFTGAPVPAGFSYDPATGSAALHPHQPLIAGRSYLMRAAGLRDLVGNTITPTFCCLRFRVAGGGGAVLPPPGVEGQSGYWMVAADGAVYSFGDAAYHGGGLSRPGTRAVDLEPTPSGNGYWIVDATGVVTPHGDAPWLGNAGVAGEEVTSISATPTGAGYWLFTTTGRVLAFGDAAHFGDLAGVRLNGPVLDSIVTPSGRGYYMVASDGGIFSFGDARFFGSMGGIRLNAPVQSLVPDPDGTGYWLVASDGGVFSFETAFRGSLGGVALNRPVNG